jgi:hypothetical protein
MSLDREQADTSADPPPAQARGSGSDRSPQARDRVSLRRLLQTEVAPGQVPIASAAIFILLGALSIYFAIWSCRNFGAKYFARETARVYADCVSEAEFTPLQALDSEVKYNGLHRHYEVTFFSAGSRGWIG